MTEISEFLSVLRNWQQGKGGDNPFTLRCRFEPPVAEVEITAVWPKVPPRLHELWRSVGEAWLCEDADYGQWGLHLLSPEGSARRTASEIASRPEDFDAGCVVLGEFLGDSDLLVIALAESSAISVLVAPPLDGRKDWPEIGTEIAGVLIKYLASDGQKYWEI